MQIQFADITQIIVAIITTAGVIYSVRKRHEKNRRRKRTEPEKSAPSKRYGWTIVTCVLLVANLANLGYFAWRNVKPPTNGMKITSEMEIKITYPYEGATVEIKVMTGGISQGIPEGQVIWIVVYPHVVGRYYPQNNPADVQADGDWSSLIHIGVEEDIGRKFDIIAVLANKEAQDAFNDYLVESEREQDYPGLESLPDGAVIYDRVTVTRK